jgi:hypothetical protein
MINADQPHRRVRWQEAGVVFEMTKLVSGT